jgi:hypothetical protein
MARMKPVLWLLLGFGVGVSTQGLLAQGLPRFRSGISNEDARVVTRTVSSQGLGSSSFIKDKQTGGCWLYVVSGEAVAMAVAPPTACD